MSGDPKFAVDTSFVIGVLKGTVESTRPFSEVAFPFVVIGELRFGAMGGRDPQRKIAEIDEMVQRSTTLAGDGETARVYANVRHRLKAAGTPLPENDIWIAAICLQHGLPLLTLDRHFDRIDGLTVATA
ncbi:MAG: type II toxin-antitoxin system VapC family toxin [Phycisphaerales bacterium]|nr:type II toxin-antitoxin system VapC family toxin [Phycisphaerales bacterium]